MTDVLVRSKQGASKTPARSLISRGRVLVAAVALGIAAGVVTFTVSGSDDGWTRGQEADIARLQGLTEHYADARAGWTRAQRAEIARLEGLAAYYHERNQ